MIKSLSIINSKKDITFIARYTFSGIIIVTIIQKLFDQQQFENLTNFVSFISILLTETVIVNPNIVFYGIILFEAVIVTGLFSKRYFNLSVCSGALMLIFGVSASIVSLYYGIQNNCGCGLFGENPYFLLTQKIIFLGLLFMVWRGKQYYFR